MAERKRALPLYAGGVLAVLGCVLYFPSIDIHYFADDFGWYFDPPPAHAHHFFVNGNPNADRSYRPLQAAFLIAVQRSSGLDTTPVHAANIAGHILLAWMVFTWMIQYGFGLWQAAVGALFMLLSQANVLAVVSNDTLSQIAGTLLGCLSLWLLDRALCGTAGRGSTVGRVRYGLSLAAFAAALLSKETSVAFLGMVFCVILIRSTSRTIARSRVVRPFVLATPYIALVALYFYVRWYLGIEEPAFHSGRYGAQLGWRTVVNFLTLILAALATVSSVSLFVALTTRDVAFLLVAAATTIAFIAAAAHGLRLSARRGLLAAAGAFAALGLAPIAAMNKVSELYTYNSMPFVSVLAGAGIGTLIEASRTSTVRRWAIISLAGILAASHVTAVVAKTVLMRDTAQQSTRLLDAITPHLPDVPEGGQLMLLNPSSNRVEYSVFIMNGFNVLQAGLHRLNELWRGSPFYTRLVQESDVRRGEYPADALVLSLDPDTGRVYRLK